MKAKVTIKITVNGQEIDTEKYESLMHINSKRTIVNQTNPLLERAARIVARL